jgi:hypothetical protein
LLPKDQFLNRCCSKFVSSIDAFFEMYIWLNSKNELVVGEVRVAAGQGEELVSVLLAGPGAAEEDQLAEGAIRRWRPESLVDELYEPAPGQRTGREL